MGFQNAQRRTTGNFIIIVNITIPAITNDEIKTKLENIRDEFVPEDLQKLNSDYLLQSS